MVMLALSRLTRVMAKEGTGELSRGVNNDFDYCLRMIKSLVKKANTKPLGRVNKIAKDG